MNFSRRFTIALVGVATAAIGGGEAGCGSTHASPGAGGSGGGGGSSVVSSSVEASSSESSAVGVSHTVASSSAGGGGTGGGDAGPSTVDGGDAGATNNHDPTHALPLAIDKPHEATFKDTSTPDFYTFTTQTPSTRLLIQTVPLALPLNEGTDPTVTLPVYELFATIADATGGTWLTQVAYTTPYQGQLSEGYLEIAEPGTYYLLVKDCNGFFTSGCPSAASQITNLGYEVLLAATDLLPWPEANANASSQNGGITGAETVVYQAGSSQVSGFDEVVLDGNFKGAGDTLVFAFTPPADVKTMANAALRADFYVQSISGSGPVQDGDLSASNIKIWITEDTGKIILAEADQSNFTVASPLDFSVPLQPSKTYYLWIQNLDPAGSATKDYYFIRHFYNFEYDHVEGEGATTCGANDTPGTAEALPSPNGTLYTVDGHLAQPNGSTCTQTSDIDWFSFTVPSSTSAYQVLCDGARGGSGLVGFNVQLYASDATTTVGGLYAETPKSTIADPSYNPLPAGIGPGDKMYLRAAATGQDATNTGTYYRCFVIFG